MDQGEPHDLSGMRQQDPSSANDSSFTPPLIDGRYRITRAIGTGALWRVFEAVDVLTTSRVVVKCLYDSGGMTAARLRREADVFKKLVHPNIVPLRGDGQSESGEPYVVYPWIDGSTLAEGLESSGPMPWRRAAELAADVARALAAAHALQIVHRDVKPSNILLDAASGQAMLTDFGAFGDLRVDSRDRFTTAGGALVGTPAYMAPEQLRGKPQTAAVDVYGLGIVLYEMLVGSPPAAGSFSEIVSRTLKGIEVQPRDDVPDALTGLLREMLNLDADRRPTMLDTAERLELIAQTTAVIPIPAPWGPLAPSASSERPASRAAGALAVSRAAVPSPVRAWILGVSIAVIVAIGFAAFVLTTRLGAPNPAVSWIPGVLEGIGLIALGIVVGVVIARRLARRGHSLEMDASRLLLGSSDPGHLRADIVAEIHVLIARSNEIDAHLLGATVIAMIEEVERAEASSDRQTALIRATELFEKLRARLSPWYVRHRKELAAVPAGASSVLGAVKIVLEIRKMMG
ncbi:MAG TPA: serine/threonine-protein kinase [Gemmatimonadaceae bacterium]|nr:serine/threonine-protein kinase [Gemmatimonadaceae bacterium]